MADWTVEYFECGYAQRWGPLPVTDKTGGRVALTGVNGQPILSGFRHADREGRDGVVVTISRELALEPPRMIDFDEEQDHRSS